MDCAAGTGAKCLEGRVIVFNNSKMFVRVRNYVEQLEDVWKGA